MATDVYKIWSLTSGSNGNGFTTKMFWKHGGLWMLVKQQQQAKYFSHFPGMIIVAGKVNVVVGERAFMAYARDFGRAFNTDD